MARTAALFATGIVLLAGGGCGGDDDDKTTAPTTASSSEAESPPPAAETTAPEQPEPEKPKTPRRERTPASLADCIREAPSVSDVLVKARDSEDATFFGDLAGGRADVLGVTVEGEPAELTVALFASAADAKKAAPSAGGGGGLRAEAQGPAVIVAPAKASTAEIEACLSETGYTGD